MGKVYMALSIIGSTLVKIFVYTNRNVKLQSRKVEMKEKMFGGTREGSPCPPPPSQWAWAGPHLSWVVPLVYTVSPTLCVLALLVGFSKAKFTATYLQGFAKVLCCER